MDFTLGFVMGIFALHWLWILAAIAVILLDIVLCENDEFGWGTGVIIGGTGVIAWLGADINVFSWIWANIAEIVKFLFLYFLVGSIWCVIKWWFYCLDIRDKVKTGKWHYGHNEYHHAHDSGSLPLRRRPYESYAKNNVSRITGWIGHWPFSMIGSLFGEVLTRILTNIYRALSGVFERVANRVFSGFDPGEEE